MPSRVEGKVYLTIDVNGLDPAVIASTGTPQPGGLSWGQTMELLRALAVESRAQPSLRTSSSLFLPAFAPVAIRRRRAWPLRSWPGGGAGERKGVGIRTRCPTTQHPGPESQKAVPGNSVCQCGPA